MPRSRLKSAATQCVQAFLHPLSPILKQWQDDQDPSLGASVDWSSGTGAAGSATTKPQKRKASDLESTPTTPSLSFPPRYVVVGAPETGKTSVLWQYALKAAHEGKNVLLVARQDRARRKPPLVFASNVGAAAVKNWTSCAAQPTDASDEHRGTSWQKALRRIRVRYLRTLAEMRRFFEFAHALTGPPPDVVLVDDIGAYFSEDHALPPSPTKHDSQNGRALRSVAAILEAAHYWTFRRQHVHARCDRSPTRKVGIDRYQSIVPLGTKRNETHVLFAVDGSHLAELDELRGALAYYCDLWLFLHFYGKKCPQPKLSPSKNDDAPKTLLPITAQILRSASGSQTLVEAAGAIHTSLNAVRLNLKIKSNGRIVGTSSVSDAHAHPANDTSLRK